MLSRKLFLIFSFIFLSFTMIPFGLAGKDYTLRSPDKKILVTVQVGDKVTYSVSYNNITILTPSVISLSTDLINFGTNPKVKSTSVRTVDKMIEPVVRQKSALIRDQFNELTIGFKGKYSLILRAYNDGMAYRWNTSLDGEMKVLGEEVNYCFDKDHMLYFPEESSMFTHHEREYKYIPVSSVTADSLSSVPVLAMFDEGPRVAITESDLFDYPGIFLRGKDDKPLCLKGAFPYYPLEFELKGDRNEKVIKRAEYMALVNGPRSFPWRIMVIVPEDKDLIASQMVFRLASEPSLKDVDWIKPGKVAWDWWNANNIYNVDFKAGINTETYKYYIDFAAKYGIEYIIMDEGWYQLGDLTAINPDINMDELVAYAKQKKVGIILWVVWKTLYDQLDDAMSMFSQWGISGIKVDFMQRDDQWMVNYYWLIAKRAAENHLLVDFHGAYKPSGLRRAFPNVLTREGVRGLEWDKWSGGANPENAVTIPFIRMLAGPMDYTPGAMLNATKEQFRYVFDKPMSQGTRCQQLAMYVVYESPLQMLADSPTHYLENEECMDFLSVVPTVWDETWVLDAKVADYVLLARRSGDEWYIGAMSDWTPRDLEADLAFLDEGQYKAIIYQDGDECRPSVGRL